MKHFFKDEMLDNEYLIDIDIELILPSLNSTSWGSHFFLKFSIKAGPKGAAPPVTALTDSSMDDLTIGWVAKKLINGGTRAR